MLAGQVVLLADVLLQILSERSPSLGVHLDRVTSLSEAVARRLDVPDEDIAPLKPNPAAVPKQDHKLPLKIRLISAIDRRHYTVSPQDGCINPPNTCAVETEADEQVATEIGAKGLEILPEEARARVNALWDTAAAAAKARDYALDPVRDALLSLLQ